jgi:hypothetical protein
MVGRGLLFHCTVEQGNKLLPFTVSVNANVPVTGMLTTAALEGESEVIAGVTRFVDGVVMEKSTEFDGAVELETVIPTVPAKAVSSAVIAAVTCVALTKFVGRGEPFQLTMSPFAKLVPFTVSVKPEGLQ